jgi:2-oxoglutarate ferredoxin oxidoreductase subunit delta
VFKVNFYEQRCKGCGYCVEFCPRKLILLDDRLNDLGYHFATIKDEDKCTGCGICSMMCPDVIIEIKEG